MINISWIDVNYTTQRIKLIPLVEFQGLCGKEPGGQNTPVNVLNCWDSTALLLHNLQEPS